MPEEAAVPKAIIEECQCPFLLEASGPFAFWLVFLDGYVVHRSTKRLTDEYLSMERKYKTASALNDTILKQDAERQYIIRANETLRKQNQELEIKVREASKELQSKLDEERRAHRSTREELESLKKHHEWIQEMFKKRPNS